MKKTLSVLLALVMTICMLTTTAMVASAAETDTQSGIEATLVTDKNAYSSGEDIKVTVNVKNTNTYDVNDVSITVELPEGLTLKSGDLSISDVDIAAGETYSKEVIAVKETSTPPTDTPTDKPTDKPADAPTDKPSTENPSTGNNGNGNTNSPQTGDTSNMVLWVALMVLSAAGIFLTVKFRKNATKFLSLFLCVVMVCTIVPTGVFAAEGDTDTVSIAVDKAITVDGTEVVIKAFVSYNSSDKPNVELSNFKASLFDIYIGTTETVTFTVNVTSNTEIRDAVNVVDDNNVIAVMNDNGTDGDLIAGDDIFSAQVELSSPEIADIEYYAMCGKAKSNIFDICFYRDLTQDEFVSYAKLLNNINSLSFDEAKQFVATSEEISYYNIDDKLKIITYKSIYGISGVWENLDNENIKGNEKDSLAEQNTSDEVIFAENQIVSDRYVNIPDISNKNIIVLRPFRTSQFTYDDFLYAGEDLRDGLEGSLTVIDDENVSLSAMKSLNNYGIILIDSHGGISDMYKKPYIITGESFDEMRFLLDPIYYATHVGYSADYLAGRIFGTGADRAGVGSRFFDKYYSDNSLDDSFWFLGCCYSFYNDSIGDSLLNKGAEAVVGFTNVVSVDYCNKSLQETVINSMLLSANTVSEGVKNTKTKYGDVDPYNSSTEIKYKGDASYHLVSANGILSGKICKASDRSTAISGATINVFKNNTLYTTQTADATGNYSIDLPAGQYYIEITAEGYIDFHSYATVTEGENTYMETFLMVEDEEENQGWKSAYTSILTDWKTIEDYHDTSYIQRYFGDDYQFDKYFLYDLNEDSIPELFLYSSTMGLTEVFTYSDGLVWCGEDVFAGIQATTHELIVHGHWHGAGGSGEYEWGSFLLADQSLKCTAYIDAVGDIYTAYQNGTYMNVTKEEYDAIYNQHFADYIAYESFAKYSLSDVRGLETW